MERPELKKVIETVLFITDRPVALGELSRLVEMKDRDAVEAAVRELQADYASRDSALRVLEIADGFQMATMPEFGAWVRKLYQDKTTFRLSTASLETLSIVAYRQPLTRAEIEEIRGVEVIAALETLLEKKLIRVVGRKETVGRPLLYGSTPEFLRLFGLKSLDELPALETFVPAPEPTPEPAAAAHVEEEAVPVPSHEESSAGAAEAVQTQESAVAVAESLPAPEVEDPPVETGSPETPPQN